MHILYNALRRSHNSEIIRPDGWETDWSIVKIQVAMFALKCSPGILLTPPKEATRNEKQYHPCSFRKGRVVRYFGESYRQAGCRKYVVNNGSEVPCTLVFLQYFALCCCLMQSQSDSGRTIKVQSCRARSNQIQRNASEK